MTLLAPCALRRVINLLVVIAAAALVGGCSLSPTLPAIRYVRLPPLSAAAPASQPLAAAVAAGADVWQLMTPVDIPGYLDRDAVLVPSGAAGLQPLAGVRWAEPLREAVPRLLDQDLAQALHAPVWQTPLPAGVKPNRQLRVEISALDVLPDRSGVLIAARWSVADPLTQQPPQVGQARFTVPATASDADALALAHRQAIADLAQRIGSSITGGG